MKIRTQDGEANVTSQGQGNLNSVLGAVGAAGALMTGTGLLDLGGNRQPKDPEDRPITRYEMGLIRENIAKDNEITLLKSQQYTDRTMAGVQQQIGMQQTWNAVQQNNIVMMQKQLGEITKYMVPESAIGAPVVPPTVSSNSQTNNG